MINILIIEDETIVGLHISTVLKRLNYNIVAWAKNAADAIYCIEKESVDLILADIKIEGEIDGISLCKAVHNLYQIPIIFLTAYKDQETLLRASKVDYAGYLLKPFREDELEAILQLTIAKYGIGQNQIIQVNLDYTYDKQSKKLFYKNEEVKLTKKELQLMILLINANGGLVYYEKIDSIIWMDEFTSDVNRRQLLYRLNSKLIGLSIKSVTKEGVCLISE